MSDHPQGPQWWQASDGRWYPPEQHPNAQHAAVKYPPPQYPAPQHAAPAPQPHSAWGQPAWQQPAAPQPNRGGGSRILVGVLLVLVVMVGGCTALAALLGSSDDADEVLGVPESMPSAPGEAPLETAPTAAPTTTTPPEPIPAPTTTPPAIMPNVVCMNLQAAQDAIQAAGVFFSRSFDASGQDRSQLVDSNWIVVSQDPAPGSPVGEAEANLGAVKTGEPSPC